MSSLFSDKKQLKLFTILCLATLFNFALIAVRMYRMEIQLADLADTQSYMSLRGTTTFLFLVWNLFLAWVPYLITLVLDPVHQRFKSRLITGGTLVCWLLFLPNAPYILTDLLHLKSRSPIPHWFDLMLILSFAWTGLMLGLLSLYRVQLFMNKWLSTKLSWLLTIGIIGLTGFGVYLGRFLRWNSWDILNNPLGLASDIFEIISQPALHHGPLGISMVISFFLLLGYLHLTTLMSRS